MLNNKHNTDYVIFFVLLCFEVKQLNIFIMEDFCIFEVEAIHSTISSKKLFDVKTIFTIHASDIKEVHQILNDYADTYGIYFDIVSIKLIKHLSESHMYAPLSFLS